MLYTGIDHHKQYSVACAMDQKGAVINESRIDHRDTIAFGRYLYALSDSSAVVMEACRNWGCFMTNWE